MNLYDLLTAFNLIMPISGILTVVVSYHGGVAAYLSGIAAGIVLGLLLATADYKKNRAFHQLLRRKNAGEATYWLLPATSMVLLGFGATAAFLAGDYITTHLGK